METEVSYTVICIDDHPLYRKGIADLLDMDDELKLVGEAADGQEGLRQIQALNPDIILLDINMKGMDGQETLKAIKQYNADTHVLMMTVSDSEEDVVTALRNGADGYLLKDMEPEDMLKSIHKALQGQIAISERLTQLLAYALRSDGDPPNDVKVAGLTDRECEILRHVAKGESNKTIAHKLSISEGTVKVHVKHVLKKLNLRSRVEAAVWALKTTDLDQQK
ncbi:MAG: two-component system response regulator NarL [Gammaproteobacteria bacterium]|nr:two-component system response regulator NarL [Gammaproteobacteria bacterium]